MLKQSPNYQPERKPENLYTVPPNLLRPPLDTSLEVNIDYEAYRAQLEKSISHARRHRFAKVAAEKAIASTLIVLAAASSGYMHDVANNKFAADKAKPSVIEAYPALETDLNEATVIYDGFNTFGARYFAKTQADSIQQAFGGKGLAVQYNNAVLDAARIGDEVDESLAEIPTLESLNFVFHSAGDVPGVDYMVDTINTSWIPVESATIIVGPADYESLTPATQDQLATAEALADIPYIEYSTFFRYILEMHFYEDALERNPLRTLDGINTRFSNGDVTSNRFLASQMKSVSNANVPGKILETDPDKFRTIYNIGVLEGDEVVNGSDAAEKICKAVEEIGHICNIFGIEKPNGGHGGYYTKDGQIAFEKLFQEIARVNAPQLAKEWQRYSEYRYALYQQDSLLLDIPE